MTLRAVRWMIVLSLVLGATSCAILDGDAAGAGDGAGRSAVMQQPVFLQPVFVLEGIEALPSGFHLDELHLGVGAIFLERLDSDDGVAYANRDPFKLHFMIQDGQTTALAPDMTLPRGGVYQVSVQIEPQARLSEGTSTPRVASLEVPGDEASLVVSGRIIESEFTSGSDEPAPLPWHPTEDEDGMGRLQRTVDVIPFSYTSQRSVRFMVDEVELTGGANNELVMHLQVGSWVRETMQPAIDAALGTFADGGLSTEPVENINEALKERLDEVGDGIDRLIGDMNIEVK